MDTGDVVSDDANFFPEQYGNVEIGEGFEIGDSVEIGAEERAKAVRAVVEKARDSRHPAPRMVAVAPDAPERPDPLTEFLSDVVLGAAAATGDPDPFPLTTKLLLRFGAGGEPRIVRVDTEESYAALRAQSSPEEGDLAARVDELAAKLEEHVNDPEAHASLAEEAHEIGAEAAALDAEKNVDLALPPELKGKVKAWHEGDLVCVSLRLPGSDGEARICTSVEPIAKGVEEMSRHAAEADVPASAVVGCLEGMGACLGAATALKEMMAAAPSILSRPEADRHAPFVVRIEPAACPALCALTALLKACVSGDQAACAEWTKLAAAARGGGASPLAQAMDEAKALLAKVMGARR